jgi:hypothetical protein
MVYKQTFKEDPVEKVPPPLPTEESSVPAKHPPLSSQPVELDFPPSSSFEEQPDPGSSSSSKLPNATCHNVQPWGQSVKPA